MMTQLITRSCATAGLLLAVAIVALAQNSQDASGLRIELPADGHVRIENQFGEVTTEVWNENYISVSTTVENGVTLKRSPVVIENRNKLVAISIVRRVNDVPAIVNLDVKVPAAAHVEIVTSKRSASLRGVPASASIRSGAGDVNVEFVGAPNADINARTTTGTVQSELPDFKTESGRVLQARLGTGARTLRINTQSGGIRLTMVEPPRSNETARRWPEPDNAVVPTKAVGVPAPLTDTQEISEGDIIRVDSQLVSLNMSVVDRATNRGLMGLARSDFRLFENGAEQEILQFDSSAAPFDLMLLIDVSGSTKDVLALIRSAALRFVDAARPHDRIGVIAFAGQPTLVSGFTLDRQSLRDRISGIRTAEGDTKLYDATDFTLNHIASDRQNRRRTAIIVMSDGLDNSIEGVRGVGSSTPYKDLVSRIQEFDGVLYALWLNTEYEALSPDDTQPEAFDAGHDRMRETAQAGGGLFYEVERLSDLAGAYERVVADLGTVYSLAYRPSDKARDGKWRAIKVNVNRPAAVARGKRGYYAN